MARHGDPPPRGRRGFPAVRGGDGPLRRLPPVGEPQGGLHRGGRVQAARPPSATCRPTAGSSHPRSRWASPVALPSWGRGSCRSRGSPGSAGTATAWPASRPRGVMWRRPPSWTRPAAGPASSPGRRDWRSPWSPCATSSTSPSRSRECCRSSRSVRLLEPTVYVRYADGGVMFGGYEDDPRVIQPESLPPEFQGPTWRSTSAFSVA